MISLFGNLLLTVALVAALTQSLALILPIKKSKLSKVALLDFSTHVVFFSVVAAFGLLIFAFAISDFSLLLVATNSHTAKPLIYKISGTWGNHEGSMLLYIFYVSIISQLIRFVKSSSKIDFYNKVLSIQGIIIFFLLIYLSFASNPFIELPVVPEQGLGLNPLLQDIGLAMHPPMLYLGYVGFTVAFSFAVAGLIEGRVDKVWAARLMPWVLATLGFLTIGIALGSWWAYRELGWGGFWFWDPVENSSLLPWLCGVALLHSLLVLQKRDALAGWSCLLAILTYALGLIGFFLVRSGILTSVHSFATDPARGVFILAIITLVVGSALFLFGVRGPGIEKKSRFSAVSRENFLLVNNLLLLVLCFTVALGTLYPIFLELFTGDKISVGAPYFNSTFNTMALVLAALAVVAPSLAWKKDKVSLFSKFPFSLIAAVIALAVAAKQAAGFNLPVAGVTAGVWLMAGMAEAFLRRAQLFSVPFKTSLKRAKTFPASYYSLILGHFGVGVLIVGISTATGWGLEREHSMKPGETYDVAGYTLQFNGTELDFGKNYIAERGNYTVLRRNKPLTTLKPERRLYPVENQQTTESSIFYRLCGDLYVVLGDPDDSGAYLTRIYHRPGMWLIWCAAACIALGLALSAGPSYGIMGMSRKSRVSPVSASSNKGQLKGVGSVLKITYFTPLVCFLLLMTGFTGGLLHATEAPASLVANNTTPLAGEMVPTFSLRTLSDREKKLTSDVLKRNRYSLVNVFASWCGTCLEEHTLLMDISKRSVVPVYGINWRDDPEAARKWLEAYGNPYEVVGVDNFGEVAIGFGITGAPETFVVAPGGKIVYRHAGALTRDVLEKEIIPLVRGRR